MLRSGYDVRTVQKFMGHRDVRTTMLYVEAVTNAGPGMRSSNSAHLGGQTRLVAAWSRHGEGESRSLEREAWDARANTKRLRRR